MFEPNTQKSSLTPLPLTPGDGAVLISDGYSAYARFAEAGGSTKAFSDLLERRAGPQVPEVLIDTNHLERALRVIPMGRKNLLFAWAEVGAKYVGILQGLPVTCRMHGINPYDYLVDVLQRINQLPASQVLTPGCGSSTPPTTPCVHLCTAPAAEQRHHPVTACNACTAPSRNVSCVKATDLGADVGVIIAMLPATHDVPETEVAPGAPSSGQSCAESVPAHGRIHQGSGSRGAASTPDSSSKAIH